MRTLLAVAVLGLAIAGCQRAPALTPAVPGDIVGSLTSRLKAEGDALVKQQQFDEAAAKYQAALNEAPQDIAIRFALAVALSHTPRRDETVEQFRIVMQRGAPGSVEVRTARDWLASAQELGWSEAVPSTTASASGTAPTASARGTGDGKRGRISGKIVWNDIEPRTQMVRLNVSLVGDEVDNREVRLGRPDFKIGKGYEFRDVVPGAYRLVAEAGGTPMWDLKVEVSAEKDTTLDLTESNATVSRDFKPPTD